MKRLVGLSQIVIFVVLFCFTAIAAKGEANSSSIAAINTIEGQVFDPYRKPVSDIYVELQNELYSTLTRVRTAGGGRFSFRGISSGQFYIKVLTSGTNYQEQVQPVEVVNVVRGGSDAVYIDIYLKFDKSKVNVGLTGVTEAVFVQEVPEEARKLYNRGVKNLDDKDGTKGFAEIEKALEIFPNYYDALNTLGREYVSRKEYRKSLPYLIKSIDINQRSFSSFYSLAYAAFQLNHIPEAVEASRGATILQPNSLNAQLLYGTTLRINGNYDKAKETLLLAKKISKNTPVAEIHWQLALLYNRIGQNKEAIEELETYLKIAPDSSNEKEIKKLIEKLRNKT